MKLAFKMTRIKVLGLFLSAFFIAIAVQMIRIQTSTHAESLNTWAENYGVEVRTVQSERGYIYDRWGHLLAGNKEVYEIGAELQYIKNPATVASTISALFGESYDEIYKKVAPEYNTTGSVFVKLTDFITSEQVQQLSALKEKYEKENPYGKNEALPSLRGLVWSAHLQRTYPEGNLAANILGFYNFYDRDSGKGYFGVEEEYNDLLSGIKQQVVIELNPYEMQEIPSAPAGASLVLTIDREIQRTVESILDKAVKKNKAASGTAIVMNPETGEILAMATNPRLNPNEYWDYSEVFTTGITFNNAVSQVYEPGSVFKIFTMASALDAGVVEPDTPFTDTGVIELGGWDIYNWDRGAWGAQTMTTCMQHSLNVCLSWVAIQLGPTKFYEYLNDFGIGHRTNIDLAGEEVYPMSVPGDPTWYTINLGTNSFGQGIAVTPIQMVMAASAIANDGKMVAPHILDSYIQNGQQYKTATQIVGMPISSETAHELTKMLETSLQEESSDALVEGYSVAGKTGTAEIAVNGQYSSYATNASFIGWGPTDDPKFLVYVWLEKPKTSIWGSVVAAPVFSSIVQQLVVLMDIPPDDVRLAVQEQ